MTEDGKSNFHALLLGPSNVIIPLKNSASCLETWTCSTQKQWKAMPAERTVRILTSALFLKATHRSAAEGMSKLWTIWTVDPIHLQQGTKGWHNTVVHNAACRTQGQTEKSMLYNFSHSKESKNRQNRTWQKSERASSCKEGRTDWKRSKIALWGDGSVFLLWVMIIHPSVWNCQNWVLKICTFHVSCILIFWNTGRKSLLICPFYNSMSIL